MNAERGSPPEESSGLLWVLGGVLTASAVALVWLATNGLEGLSVVVGGILALIAAWTVLPIRRRRRRAREVGGWALAHGWQVEPSQARTVISGTEVLRGVVEGISVTSCTTEFDPDWRRGVDTTRYRHLLTSNVEASFPALTMVPTGGVRRPPAGPYEGPGLRFESADFDAGWLVQCSDARFAHGFCHPRLIERLMRPDVAGMSLLVVGGDVAVHALGATALEAVETRAAVLADLVRLVPSYLIAEYGVPVGTPPDRRVPTVVLRGASPGEATGWPTVAMTTIAPGVRRLVRRLDGSRG